MRTGIDTRIMKSRPLEIAFEKIARLFDLVELCASHIRSELERCRCDLDELARRVRKMCRELNVRVVQVHAPYGELDEMLADSSRVEKGVEIVRGYVRFCSMIECPVLVMHLPLRRLSLRESYLEYISSLRESTRRVMKLLDRELSEYSVKIAFENRLEQVFGSCPRDIAELIEEENTENFGICLDTGHANVNKLDLEHVVESYGKYIIATHVHDNDGTQDRHAPPLTGTIPWRRFVSAMRRCCPDTPLVLEVEASEDCAENVLMLCRLVADYLRGLAD